MRETVKAQFMLKLVVSLLIAVNAQAAGFVRGAVGTNKSAMLSTSAAGDMLIGCAGWGSSTVTASVDSSWTSIAQIVNPAGISAACWKKTAPGGGVTFTVTFSGTVGNNVHLLEYSGLGSLDTFSAVSASGTAVSASLSADAGEIVIQYAQNLVAASWTGGAMTIRTPNSRGIVADGTGLAAVTQSVSSAWNAIAFTFELSGEAPPPPSGQAPPKPELVNARAVNARTVELFWRGSTSVDHYNVYRATPLTWDDLQPTSWTTPVLVGSSKQDGVFQVGYLDTDLQPETPYVYLISSVAADGSESEPTTTLHGNAVTPVEGNWINSWATVWPRSVSLGQPVYVVQVVTCNPACTIGHHDLHRALNFTDASILRGPGSDEWVHSVPDSFPATTHVSTMMIILPSAGLWHIMEDAHVFGSGFVNVPPGFMPHKEGIIFEVQVH